jgi:hypothetical protein
VAYRLTAGNVGSSGEHIPGTHMGRSSQLRQDRESDSGRSGRSALEGMRGDSGTHSGIAVASEHRDQPQQGRLNRSRRMPNVRTTIRKSFSKVVLTAAPGRLCRSRSCWMVRGLK